MKRTAFLAGAAVMAAVAAADAPAFAIEADRILKTDWFMDTWSLVWIRRYYVFDAFHPSADAFATMDDGKPHAANAAVITALKWHASNRDEILKRADERAIKDLLVFIANPRRYPQPSNCARFCDGDQLPTSFTQDSVDG